MKTIIKKTGMICVALLLMLQVYVLPAYAADGEVFFTDPQTEVGEKVDISVRVYSAGTQFGNLKFNVKYNPELLKFEQGTNAVDENGNINLTANLDAGTSDVTFVLTFTTLKEGTTKLTVSDYTATNSEGTNVELTVGDSTITIGEGGPVEETPQESEKENVPMTIEGENYTVNSTFSEKEIPAGFEVKDVELQGKKVKALYNEESGVYLYSLKKQSGETNFFLLEELGASLKKTVVVDVSLDKYIMIIDPEKEVSLPKKYQSTTMTLNGTDFSIWNNVEDQDYYLIYALNTEGKPGYYQYDAVEGTYQRCNENLNVKNEKQENGILSKAAQYTSNHILEVICIVGALFLIFAITIIVLAVKLSKRPSIEEEFYSEDEGEEIVEKPENRKRQNNRIEESVYEEEPVYEEESMYEEEEPMYEEEELSDYEIEFDDYYDEEEFDDEEEEFTEDPVDEKDDDDFFIDFIEL